MDRLHSRTCHRAPRHAGSAHSGNADGGGGAGNADGGGDAEGPGGRFAPHGSMGHTSAARSQLSSRLHISNMSGPSINSGKAAP